jgi:hypothetical protein
MEYKIVNWPDVNGAPWLVAVTGSDGSYSPLARLNGITKTRTEPTYNNQRYQAAQLLTERGIEALNNPHAMIGRTCNCGTCFCCAAAEIEKLAREVLR